ncbi:MAG: PIN domain-containing protein [Coriobacteriales bacterium]|jgi:predicted nucleic acid-binding protein|nr:PIN domain-containing protein [Coriobacteriales bacterium]
MILVDTSVWVEFFKRGFPQLRDLLAAAQGTVVTHEMVVGELALCGHVRNRNLLAAIESLYMVRTVPLQDYLSFVLTGGIAGRGIGYVDANLLLSCIDHALQIWTLDKSLAELAAEHNCLFSARL